MKPNILIAGLLIGTSLMANPYESKQEEIASVVETGKKASMQLLKTLGSNLKKHMKAEGPVGAAKFCSTRAFPLTDQVSAEQGSGVTVKRISLKYRNPANQAENRQELAILTSFQTLQDNNVILPEYLVEQVDTETYKFYKPLNINKGVCLKCHGTIKNPKVASFIKANYPEDKATGYKMGDLRGAIVVTIKK
ncbi:MAG: DUF3365 domain-containing protein [Campylobacterota bacterium]|nr:DUF3365 domain-containing protein [Campylobacterota bacterium]